MTLHDKAVEAAARVMCCRPHASGWVCPSTCEELRRHVLKAKPVHDAIMATYAAAGWKLMPRDATEEMMFAGHEAARKVQVSGISGMTIDAQMRNKSAREIAAWSAMHNAAPSPEDTP